MSLTNRVCFGFRVLGFGVRMSGSGVWAWGFGLRIWDFWGLGFGGQCCRVDVDTESGSFFLRLGSCDVLFKGHNSKTGHLGISWHLSRTWRAGTES